MKLDSLNDLLLHEVSDLYDAENQLVKALPLMAEAAFSPELRDAFNLHLEQTREQISRLDEVFEALSTKPEKTTCKAMAGLIAEAQELLKEKDDADPYVMDAALIAAAQRVEHYEIAGYGCARTFASRLGLGDAEDLLQEILDEEIETDRKLTNLAESMVNDDAATTDEDEDEEGEEEEEESAKS